MLDYLSGALDTKPCGPLTGRRSELKRGALWCSHAPGARVCRLASSRPALGVINDRRRPTAAHTGSGMGAGLTEVYEGDNLVSAAVAA
jgi:hypothetical protein